MLLLWQIIWYIALFVGVLTFIEKNDKKCLHLNVAVCFLWATHYFLLWLPAASYILVSDGVKSILAVKYKGNIALLLLLLVWNVCIWRYTFDGTLSSLLPVTTSTIWTIWVFLSAWLMMRFVFLLVVSIWLTYNCISFSLPAIVSNLITLWAVIVWLFRVYRGKKS